MSKKILFCATVDSHFRAFHIPYLKFFKEQGWEVHVAASGSNPLPYVDLQHHVPFSRSPYHLNNLKAYLELKRIMAENQYEIMHFHIPVSAALGRIVAMKYRRRGTKVVYTSHGHYYYKGASILSWILYFPIEKLLAHVTDCLITINEEDYQLSIKKQRGTRRIEKVLGMGVDLERFGPVSDEEKLSLRKKHGFSESDFILIYPAEHNRNKNQKVLIQTISILKDKFPNIKLLLPGVGPMSEDYKKLANQLHLNDYVLFPGFRADIDEWIKLADVSVASSLREGLGLNLIEGMACGKPVVAVDNRGHREVVREGINGYLTKNNAEDIAKKLLLLAASKGKVAEMGRHSYALAQYFGLNNAAQQMKEIYLSMVSNERQEEYEKESAARAQL